MDVILNYIQSFTNRFVIYTEDIYPADKLADVVGIEYVHWLYDLMETDVEQFKRNYLSLIFTECIYIDILLYKEEYYMYSYDSEEFLKVSITNITKKIDQTYEFVYLINWDYFGLDDDIRNISSRQRDELEYESEHEDMDYSFTQTKRRKITE